MDNATKITLMLDNLADMQAQRDVLNLDEQATIDHVLTPEILKAIADIKDEFAGKAEALVANITELEAAIKAQVVAHGETVWGKRIGAVWSKPRVSWNTKALDGYAAAHPEIAQFRTTGEPSVSIRKV